MSALANPLWRLRLLLFLALPALCVPRGVALEWCFCAWPGVGTEHACCEEAPAAEPVSGCCAETEAERAPLAALARAPEAPCPGCRTLLVEDFGERLDVGGLPALPSVVALALPVAQPLVSPDPGRGRGAAPLASHRTRHALPPDRPGVLPLRI